MKHPMRAWQTRSGAVFYWLSPAKTRTHEQKNAALFFTEQGAKTFLATVADKGPWTPITLNRDIGHLATMKAKR